MAAPARIVWLALAALTLAGCGKREPPAPPPAAPPPRAAETTDPLPAAPSWAAPLIGQPVTAAFPKETACLGNTDVVARRFTGAAPGVEIAGWGWDQARKAAVPRVVLVDRDQKIVGAGETGTERPDVVAARRQVTSRVTGWGAVTSLTEGALDAYGIVGPGTACKLGHIEF